MPETQATLLVVAPDIDAAQRIQAGEHAVAVPIVAGNHLFNHRISRQLTHPIDPLGNRVVRSPAVAATRVPQTTVRIDEVGGIPQAGHGHDARCARWERHPRRKGAANVSGIARALLPVERTAPGAHRTVVHDRGHEVIRAVIVRRRAVGVHQCRGNRAVAIGHEAKLHAVGAVGVKHHVANAADGHSAGQQMAFENCVLLTECKRLRLAMANDPGTTVLENHITLLIAQERRVDSAPAIAKR